MPCEKTGLKSQSRSTYLVPRLHRAPSDTVRASVGRQGSMKLSNAAAKARAKKLARQAVAAL
jgi:hypothetical protein